MRGGGLNPGSGCCGLGLLFDRLAALGSGRFPGFFSAASDFGRTDFSEASFASALASVLTSALALAASVSFRFFLIDSSMVLAESRISSTVGNFV